MHELVVIERNPLSYKSWPGLIKKNKVKDLEVEEVVKRYQGIEGELISYSLIEENEPFSGLSEFLSFENKNRFVLHLLSNPTSASPYLKNHAIKVGYDVGFCEEWTLAIFSSIFHEVLFGSCKELVVYKEKLNNNFLFPSKEIAEEYVRLHDEMSAKGRDVEDIVEMKAFEIWLAKQISDK